MKRPFVLLPLLLVPSSIGWSQDTVPAIDARVDVSRLTVGDRVRLTLTARHDSAETVAWPESPDLFRPFELMELRGAALPDSGGLGRSQAQYTLTIFEVGDVEIPSVEIGIGDAASGETRIVQSPSVSLTVESVQPDSSDIADIKAPLAIARNWLLVLPWVAAAAMLMLLGVWAYRRQRHDTKDDAPGATGPPQPPHIVALEALDRLERSDMLERGHIKRYFSDISEIVRVYIEGRYGVDAMEMTSHDILHALRALERPTLDRFRDFFTTSDLVKFAKLRPDIEACRAMIPMARVLVESTTPVELDPLDDTAVREPDFGVPAGMG